MLVQHQEESHPGEAPDYEMKVVKHHNKTMLRQIHERILTGFTGSGLLNRRREWGSNLPQKLEVESEKSGDKRKGPKTGPTIHPGGLNDGEIPPPTKRKRRCNNSEW